MDKLIELARATRNRGRTHIFLGDPRSDACDKTTVEPGNTFSPGAWTCGIAPWIKVAGELFTPDLLPETELDWRFAAGLPPVLETRFPVGKATCTGRLTHLGGEGADGVDFCEFSLSAQAELDAMFYLVVKDTGPAGGPIQSLVWNAAERRLLISDSLQLVFETAPDECRTVAAETPGASPLAIVRFNVNRAREWRVAFKAEHGFGGRMFDKQLAPYRRRENISVEDGFKRSAAAWEKQLPARVFCPDARIAQAWEHSAFHVLANMECGLPRIGALNYPGFWMRDCVLVLRALDLIGRADLARMGCEYLAPLYFSGGFGAESDAPGEGIWALVSHAQMTRDTAFLSDVFPHIQKRLEWLNRMLTATAPLRYVGENRIPQYMNSPGINILCLPAQNGLIHGRMDGHSPDFFINCWAVAGFKKAAAAARELGRRPLADDWSGRARQLEQAIEKFLLPQYGNERDPIITPHPTGALGCRREVLREKFEPWYRARRLTPDGARKPEPLWTYFEAAQIHNAMQLGLKDLGWINLDGLLNDGQRPWPVSAYVEGVVAGNECLPFRNGESACGWLDPKSAAGGNMPHLWTAAELLMLIRNMFVMEHGDEVLLGQWAPPSWLKPGARFGVRDMPTLFGPVSYTVAIGADGKPSVDYRGKAPHKLAL